MHKSDAETLHIFLLQCLANMDDSTAFVRDRGSDAEFLAYRLQAGNIMGGLVDAMNSIYLQHPDLKPQAIGGPYAVDSAIYKDRFYADRP